MPAAYPQRVLTVLLLFGTLSAAMALLASSLIFQLPSVGTGAGALPELVAEVLLPVSAVLAALCLVLNVSCLLLCLLHGYFSTELCRGQPGADRAGWFLLDSRTVRHAAIGLFCCGVSLYLTALAIYMLLLFELEAGIASACILSSGILVLLLTVTHTLLRVSRLSRHGRPEAPHSLYENDSAQPGEAPGSDPQGKGGAASRPRADSHRPFSFPVFLERKSQLGSGTSSNLSSSGSAGRRSDRDGDGDRDSSELPRRHRTLSAESALLQAQAKPWNVVTQEMRNVMSHKATGKDSTLV